MRKFFLTVVMASIPVFGIISDAVAKTGCFVENHYVYCYNEAGKQIFKWGTAGDGNYNYKVADYTTDEDKLIVTRIDGAVVEVTYDGSANTVSNHYIGGSSDVIGNINVYTYDATGNKISWKQRSCSSFDSTGNCIKYSSNKETSYNEDGNITSVKYCNSYNSSGICTKYTSGTDYAYDDDGNQTYSKSCKKYNSSGNCTTYSSGSEYTYDENGNKVTYRNCEAYDNKGNCTTYYSGIDYTYDDNGNQTYTKYCFSYNNDITGHEKCTTYSYGSYSTYDDNGNQTSHHSCSSYDSNGNCTKYSGATDYIYDENGKQTSSRYCDSNIDSNGNCKTYSSATDYTYDENGNNTSTRACSGYSGSNPDSDGNCTKYTSGFDYTYDENGYKTSYSHVSCDRYGKCTVQIYSCTVNCAVENEYTATPKDGNICTADNSFCVNFDCSYSDSYSLTHGICSACKNNLLLAGGKCYKCPSSSENCEVRGDKVVSTSCVNGYILADGKCLNSSNMACSSIDNLNYCMQMEGDDCSQYVVDENQKTVAKMSCKNCERGKNKQDCQTFMYDENGNVTAIYDDDEPVAAYDYDNRGDIIAEYDNQCEVESCADNYLNRGDACVTECNGDFKQNEKYCNRIRWTPVEAAKVLTDDNNNSVTLTFKH